MKVVRLYGELGAKFGREFTLDVRTPAEALRALGSQLKGFTQFMFDRPDDRYKVIVGAKSRTAEGLTDPVSDKEVIRFVPVVQGAGGDLGKIIIGAVLIYLTWGAGASILAGWGASAGVVSFVGNIGVGLLLGGVASMLAGTPETNKSTATTADNGKSFGFDGVVNTVRQGNPVPLAYGGPIRVGSQVISAGLTTVDA